MKAATQHRELLRDADLAAVERELRPDEFAVAWFVADLDGRLLFARSLLVLTNRRLLARELDAATTAQPNWRSWEVAEIAGLRARERGGAGRLELASRSGELTEWRYTVAAAAPAHAMASRLQELQSGAPIEVEEAVVEPDETAADTWNQVLAEQAPRVWSLLRLARFARSCRGLIVLGIALTLASTTLSLVPPYLTIPLVDDVLVPYQTRAGEIRAKVASGDLSQSAADAELGQFRTTLAKTVALLLTGLGGAAIGAWGLGWAQGAVMAWVSERISANLRSETYAHLVRLSLEYFSKRRTGDLIARISSDTDRICAYLSDTLLDFGSDVLMIVGTAIILFWIDPLLAAASLFPVPLIIWLIYRVRASMQHGFSRGGRAWGEMTSVLADSIPGIRVVKAFAQESREIQRFRATNQRVVDANDRVNAVWTFFWPMVALLNQFGLLVVWAFGAWAIFGLQIKVGVLTGFIAYISRFYMRVESMSRVFSLTQRAAASAQRIVQILEQQSRIADPENPVACGRILGRIEFRHVCFRYASRPVLDGIDLAIEPGEMVGLVGPSGAGKTTLINLVCRFYDVSEGAILVDGTDIREFAVEGYRRNIGLVLQEPFLFYGTVAENIAYGRPDATAEEIIEAACAARAHDFILRLPDGYDSIVGERGQSLSGGERQRISIARALLIDPRILILDEATSSVDTETEREIQLALENLIQGRTTIAIAHRLSTLRRADRLVVLEQGRVVEVGPHEKLLAEGGAYARLYRAQLEMSKARAQLDRLSAEQAGLLE